MGHGAHPRNAVVWAAGARLEGPEGLGATACEQRGATLLRHCTTDRSRATGGPVGRHLTRPRGRARRP